MISELWIFWMFGMDDGFWKLGCTAGKQRSKGEGETGNQTFVNLREC